jgi:DNA-binding NtrC family response regulator
MWDTRILLLEFGRLGLVGQELKGLLSVSASGVTIQHELVARANLDHIRRLSLNGSVGVCFVLPNAAMVEAGAFLQRFNEAPAVPPVLVVVDSQNQSSQLMSLANDFLMTPLRPEEVISRVRRWSRSPSDEAELAHIKEKIGLKQLIGTSPPFAAAVKNIPAVARSEATVMILGETGTGKEVFARAIHYLGKTASGPFMPVNCGAIPTELMENE